MFFRSVVSSKSSQFRRLLSLVMALAVFATTLIVTIGTADAAIVRPFTRRFGAKTTGDVVMIANTVLTCPGSCTGVQNGTTTGATSNNNGQAMVYIDSDGAAPSPLAAGGTITTFDSSSSTYALPVGARVLFAGLYWGGDSSAGTGGLVAPTAANRNKVLFRQPGSTGYTELTSNISGAVGSIDVENGSGNEYHSFFDITSMVSASPSGLYTVANLQAGTGNDREGGWAIVFVIEDSTLPARDLTVFDGFAAVTTLAGDTSSVSVTVTGLLTPPSGIVNTSVGAVSYEGDRNTSGDNIQLNGTALSNTLNTATNFFNSSLTTLTGGVTPAQMAGTPNYVNALGYDADTVTANGILGNNVNTATVTFNTTGDFFYPGVLTFVTELYAPKLDATKVGVDLNGGNLEPGDVIEYTIDVTNNGEDPSVDTKLIDPIPVGTIYIPGSMSITAGANLGAKTDAATDDQADYSSGTNELTIRLGTGATATTGGSLAVAGTTQMKFRVRVDPNIATNSSIVNRARLSYQGQTIGGGTILSSASNVSTTNLVLNADLVLAKTHTGTFAAGSTNTYSFVITNNGPNTAVGPITVTDTLPAGMTYVPSSATNGWTCSATPLVCTSPTAIANSTTSSFEISVLVATSAAAGNVTNTASVASVSVDPVPANNTATDPTPVTRPVDIAVSKTDGAAAAIPGSPISYTVTVTNNGPLAAMGVTVADTVPSAITGVTWTCVATASSSCGAASGSGNSIATIANLAVGGRATYVISGTLDAATPGGVATLTNSAVANAPGMTELTPADNSAADTNDVTPRADLAVTKTNGVAAAVPGTTVSYTVTVSNSGPSLASGISVNDNVPAAITGVTWTCVAGPTAACGSAAGSGNNIATTADLPVGRSVTYTVTGTLSATTPGGTGTLVNTATATTAPGTTDPNPGNNSATDTDNVAPQANLRITKTDSATTVAPGQALTYTVVVTNDGPSTVTGATVTDPIPAAILTPTWTCAASGTGSCATPSGTGNVATLVTLAAGETATVEVNGTLDPSALPGAGALVNTATATLPVGVTDPTPGPTEATDTNNVSPIADLQVTKTDNASTAIPGQPIVYTVAVLNNGPSTATNAVIADTVPPSIIGVTWTCATTGSGSSCSSAAGSSNTISLPVTLRPGATATLTITGTLAPGTPAGTNSLSNSARATVPVGTTDPDPANNSATDLDSVTPVANLAVVKTRNPGATEPGGPVSYNVTVTNAGPSAATNAVVTDVVSSAITGVSWTCAATGSGASCSSASGSGNTISLPVTLPLGTSATMVITGTIAPTTPAGPLDNMATVAAAAGTTDPDTSNNSSAVTSTVAPFADLRISKSRTGAAVPGSTATYLVTATNNGPTGVVGALITDNLPAAFTAATWTCAPANGGGCAASGSGSLSTLADLPSGASVTFTITGIVSPGATGTLSNTATIAPPSGVTDPRPGNNTATDIGALNPSGDLAISKTNGGIASTPGSATSYTIRVTNTGPSVATNAAVNDTVPASLSGVTWTCTATPGSTCTAPSGTGSIASSVTLVGGGVATYELTGTIAPNASGSLTNTATVTAPGGFTDTDTTNNTATDTDALGRVANLGITKTDGAASSIPGSPIRYTVVVSNAGPSSALAAAVDSLPSSLINASWTCAPSGAGASCAVASGTGNAVSTVTLPPGTTATFVIDATIDPAARGNVSNTASVTPEAGTLDPDPSDNSATDDNNLVASADLEVTKTNGVTTLIPGSTTTYTIRVSNNGPSVTTGASIVDTLPTSLTNATWTCVASSGSACANASGFGSINSTADLAVGGAATYTLTATVDPATPAGTLTNTATATNQPGTTDPTPGNATASDSDTLTPTINLTTVKTDGTPTIVPGTSTTYTIGVSNTGPSTAVGTVITDVVPAALSGVTWVCSASPGSSCSAPNGSGNVSITANVAPSGSVIIRVTASLDPTAQPGSIVNVARASVPSGSTDTNPGDNESTDTNTITPRADLIVTKDNGGSQAIPGTSTSYTVTVRNAGPSTSVGGTVTDIVPAILTGVSWTCAASAGSTCTTSGTGNITDTVTVAPGGTLTYIARGNIPATATGTLSNTARATVPTGTTDVTPADNDDTDSDPLVPTADIALTKSAPSGPALAGLSLTYTITASNNGPSVAAGITVADAPPATLLNPTWTCAASAGSTCPNASGTGAFSEVVTLAVGGSVTYLLSATVDPLASGTITNTATVTYPPTLTDPTPGPTTAVDTRPLARSADLTITKTDGSGEAIPGAPITYTINVSNNGPSAVVGATVTDSLPSVLRNATWTCVAAGGAACGSANGSGSVNLTADFAPGSLIVITVNAEVHPSAPSGELRNVASVTAPTGVFDPNPTDNSATDTSTVVPQTDLAITKTDGAMSLVAGAARPSYVIEVTNNGPSTAINAPVTDTLPAGLINATWTCAVAAPSSCAAGSGVGSIASTVTLTTGTTATYTLVADLDPSARGLIANTAAVNPAPGARDVDFSNNTALDQNIVTASADLTVVKTNGVSSVAPGDVVTYTITLANAGPSSATGVTVTDPLVAPFLGATWTCAAAAPSVCPSPSGSGGLAETGVVVVPGNDVVYRVFARVDPAARGTLTNSVLTTQSETDPNPADNRSTDTDPLVPTADLGVTKSDGSATITPGGVVTYTIVAFNQGPSSITRAKVSDVLPKGLSDATWTCAGTEGGTCDRGTGSGNPDVFVDLPAGSSVTILVKALVAVDASGNILNTAKISIPAGVTDPDLTNNEAADDDKAVPEYDLSIMKTNGQEISVPGEKVTYTLEVTNNGPSFGRGIRVLDDLPEFLTESSWTCTGSCLTFGGLGAVDATVDIPVKGKAIITITATIDPNATGNLRNQASVAPGPDGTDTNPGNNVSADEDKLEPKSDIVVTKTDDVEEVVAGEKTKYTITVTNRGPSTAKKVAVTDTLPAELTRATWSCAATPKSTCAAATGSGSIATTVDLQPDGVATFVLEATVDPSAVETVANTASASAKGDPDESSNSAVDTNKVVTKADLSVTKKHTGKITAGEKVTYTIVVSNAGPSTAKAAQISDPLPTGLVDATWTCVAVAASKCGAPSGSGALESTADLVPGASVTYTFTAMVDVDAPDDVTNTVSVIPPTGAIDPNPDNNIAVDGAKNERIADVKITKSDGRKYAVQGRENTYTIVVSNTGPSSAIGVLVSDDVPKAMSDVTWSCSASVGSTCATTSGSGDLVDVQVNIRPKGTVTFLVTGTVSPTALADLVNTATAKTPASLTDPDLTNNSATDRDVMWKEWLKNPPKKKTKGAQIETDEPADKPSKPAVNNSTELPGPLALTGNNARDLALYGLFLVTGGAVLHRTARRRPLEQLRNRRRSPRRPLR